MRNVVIKVIVEDEVTELNVESVITYKQVVMLDQLGIDIVNEVLPQLHRELDEKMSKN